MDALLADWGIDLTDPLLLTAAGAVVALVLAGEALWLLLHDTRAYRSRINRRLVVASTGIAHERVLLQLRRERGLGPDGGMLSLSSLRRLVVQSGLRITGTRLGLVVLVFAIATAAAVLATGEAAKALAAAAAAAVILPPALLIFARNRRRARFALQFPQAIDIIVRSLRAGYPVPVALAMVAREMPDPVGSEFGIMADEITYGADIETAMRAMMGRVGQEDLPLFVTSVAIQATTGGNLGQILENLATVIRERFKMRRKIRGLSAEGRVSAMILNAMPLVVFVSINLINPAFYGEVWHLPITTMVFGGGILWMIIGNLIMWRMINFKV